MRTRIWVGIVVAGLALVAGVLGWWQWWMVRPMGFGPAGPAPDRTAFAAPWSDRPVILVGIGDSVTAGFGASPGHSYFDRLTHNASSDTPDVEGLNLRRVFPNLTVTNLSLSGSTSLHHARTQIPRLQRQPTNVLGVVVMTTGGNDLIHNYGRTPPTEGALYGATWSQAQPWMTNFAQRLETMITRVLEAFPGGCQIFLANIYDPTDGIGDLPFAGLPAWQDAPAIHAEFNRLLAEAAQRHPEVHLVDIYRPFLGHGIHCRQFWRDHYDHEDPHYWFHANLEDPNDRGYDALRRLFLREMAAVFSRPQGRSVDSERPAP